MWSVLLTYIHGAKANRDYIELISEGLYDFIADEIVDHYAISYLLTLYRKDRNVIPTNFAASVLLPAVASRADVSAAISSFTR